MDSGYSVKKKNNKWILLSNKHTKNNSEIQKIIPKRLDEE